LRRRDFLAGAAGAAAWSIALPRITCAQRPPTPTIGLLQSSAEPRTKLAAFYDGLRTQGFVRSQNVAIEYRSAEGDSTRLPDLVADLVNRNVALIAADGVAAAAAVKTATATIPVVFAVASDPVRLGLAASLNRPGGHMTGVTNMAADLERKRLNFLHQMVPAATGLAFLVNPANPDAQMQSNDAVLAGSAMGLKVDLVHAGSDGEFDAVFGSLGGMHAGGLAISNDGLFESRSRQLAAAAARHAVPAIFQNREFVAAGGLMSYGSSVTETYHQVGVYCGLILAGASPAELPVYRSTNVEAVINVKTAKQLGLVVPPEILAIAAQVAD